MGNFFANRSLVSALNSGSIKRMQESLDRGADVNTIVEGFFDSSRKSIFYIAVEANNYDIAKFLIDRGADVDIPQSLTSVSNTVRTPLMEACKNLNYEMVKLLLDNKAKVNKRVRGYGTALHYAARTKSYDIVKLLITSGANIKIKNDQGRTAKQEAILKKNKTIAEYLAEEEIKLKIMEAKVEAGWKLISVNEIMVVTKKTEIGYSLTEIFNFASSERTYTTIYKNLVNGNESHNVKSFDEFIDKQKIEKAFNKLIERGGRAERKDVFGRIINKKSYK